MISEEERLLLFLMIKGKNLLLYPPDSTEHGKYLSKGQSYLSLKDLT